jgi:hypothetical protein
LRLGAGEQEDLISRAEVGVLSACGAEDGGLVDGGDNDLGVNAGGSQGG